jgi:2-keto-4-pentenoate hydratase
MSSLPTAELAADPRVRRGMERQLAERRRLIEAGGEPLGWKLGFGAPAALEKLGTGAPLVGFLMRSALVDSGAEVAVGSWTSPAIEPEVAVRVGPDASIAAVGPAFELADVDPPPEDVEEILAGNIFQRHVVLGPVGSSLAGATAYVDGGDEGVEPEALTGPLPPLVAHVAGLLEAFGETLAEGDVVIAGSIVPPIQTGTGRSHTYELRPIGSVSVRLG